MLLLAFLFFSCPPVFAALVYQDFEPGNGTPAPYNGPAGAGPEYGWGFNGAVVHLSEEGDPVHSGQRSWKATIPAGPPVNAGTAIPAQTQTYNVNFIPECHNRLTFWVWSNPSNVGDHTVMVKFFDDGLYKHKGIGVWTVDQAVYQQWTPLTILFSQLPADFNLRRVDKIEFFHYWDGTYYYDDIQIVSTALPQQDIECLQKERFVFCLPPKAPAGAGRPAAPAEPVVGMPSTCVSVYGTHAVLPLEYGHLRAARTAEGLQLLQKPIYGRF